jgi:hypothetical protein
MAGESEQQVPTAGVTAGTETPAPSGDGNSTEQGEGTKTFSVSEKDWQSAQQQIEDLKKNLNGVIRAKQSAEDKAKATAAEKLTVEEQIAALRGDVESERSARAAAEKSSREAATANEILDQAKVPAGNRKLARLALQELGLDLAAAERESVVAEALKKLPEAYPQLLKDADGTPIKPNVPHHPLVSNGAPVVQGYGIKNDVGDSLL